MLGDKNIVAIYIGDKIVTKIYIGDKISPIIKHLKY